MQNDSIFSTFIAGFWRLNHWQKTDQALLAHIEECIELGVTTMDHAMVYRSEAQFGRALALSPGLRDKMQIVTKFGIKPCGFGDLGAEAVNHYDSSAPAIIESVNASLRDLGTDIIDVLLVHRPDYLMHAHEVATVFAELHKQGKVKHFGVSNFTPSQFALLNHALSDVAGIHLVTNQIEFSPLHMDPLNNGVLDQCQQTGVSPMLWSCLAGGALLSPQDDRGQRILDVLTGLQGVIDAKSIEQVVYAWLRSLPCNAHPLLGTSQMSRIREAVAGSHLTLSREQWYSIWEASMGSSVP